LTRKGTTVKTASKLLSAAFVAAAIVSTAVPMARPAQAASGPDLVAVIGPTDIQRNGGDGGDAFIYAHVKNAVAAESAATAMFKHCGYLPDPNGGRLVQWPTVDALHAPVPAPDPGQGAPDTDFYCPVSNGRMPLAARLVVATGQGETNTAYNKLTSWIFTLD
jgi:hypothetical protein